MGGAQPPSNTIDERNQFSFDLLVRLADLPSPAAQPSTAINIGSPSRASSPTSRRGASRRSPADPQTLSIRSAARGTLAIRLHHEKAVRFCDRACDLREKPRARDTDVINAAPLVAEARRSLASRPRM
jgi:hypothetical protein